MNDADHGLFSALIQKTEKPQRYYAFNSCLYIVFDQKSIKMKLILFIRTNKINLKMSSTDYKNKLKRANYLR